MIRRASFTITLLCLFAATGFAQYGKVSGRVQDQKSGEPLVGASVIVLGTTMGASTDADGRYTIQNISPGTYDIKATYVGYQQVTFTGIQVTAGLTREVNFALPTSEIETAPITIVATRPLIEKSATSMTRIVKSEDFEKLPVRGTNAYVLLQPGVVDLNGTIFIRGSRANEVGYTLDGAGTTNILGSGSLVTTIPEAVEEVLVKTGGYSAEFGGANAGIIQQNLKTAKDAYSVFVQYETDNFGNYPNKQFLGTYSYGYNNTVVGFGGPIVTNNIKLFLVGENAFTRDYNPQFWYGADFGTQLDNGFRSGNAGAPSPGPVRWGDGNIPGRFNNRYTMNGTLQFDYNPLLVRVSSSLTTSRQKINTLPILNLFDQERLPQVDNNNYLVNVKGTYFLSPTTFVEVNLSRLHSDGRTYDPNFGDDFLAYADSARGAEHGWKYVNATTPPYAFTFNGFDFNAPGSLLTGYNKNDRGSYGMAGSLTHQWGRHELHLGASYERWTVRGYTIGNLPGILSSLALRPGIQKDEAAYLQYLRQSTALGGNLLNNYGYDELGRVLDSGPDGPKHPRFVSAYVQDKFEWDDLIINAGLRLDNIFIDSYTVVDPTQPTPDPTNLQVQNLKTASGVTYVSPRVGFSFLATERTVFHVQYGKFVQAPELGGVFYGRHAMYSSVGYNQGTPLPSSIQPVQTVQYEAGFTQQLGDVAALDITGYYKDIKGLVQLQLQQTASGWPLPPYYVNANGDFATTSGFEVALRIQRSHRLAAQANYTLSDAKGTNSFPFALWGSIAQGEGGPTMVNPLTYDYRHRGSIVLDYRWGRNDGGPILQELGLNVLLSFNSGHAFTRATGGLGQLQADAGGILNDNDPRQRSPVEPINSSKTPWAFNIDFRIDKTFSIADLFVNAYLRVTNVLNTKNVTNVYLRTGNAYSDGYLTDPTLSEKTVRALGQMYVDMYKAINLQDRQNSIRYNNVDLFGTPRQIRIGLRVEY